MKRTKRLIVLAFFILLVISRCTASTKPEINTSSVSVPSESSGWIKEWEQVTKTAKAEGKVVIFTTWRPEARQEIAAAFKSRHGIEIEFILGRGNDIAEKIIRERKAGIYYADLFIGGATTMMTVLRPAGIFSAIEPHFILPEVKNPQIWMNGRYPVLDSQGLIFHATAHDAGWDSLTYNYQMVKQEEIKAWKDLLAQKFKGKIVMNDPTVAGRGQQIFAVGMHFLGIDYWRELSKQQVEFTRDQRLITDWVAKGKYLVSIAALNEVYNEYMKTGAPIGIAQNLADGFGYLSTASSNIGMVSNPPHPYAAKTFLNWFLTREALTIFVQNTAWHSTRLDVSTESLPPSVIRKSGFNYLIADSEEFLQKKLVYQEQAREIFDTSTK